MINKVLKTLKYSMISLLTISEIGFCYLGYGFLFTPIYIALMYFILTEEV